MMIRLGMFVHGVYCKHYERPNRIRRDVDVDVWRIPLELSFGRFAEKRFEVIV